MLPVCEKRDKSKSDLMIPDYLHPKTWPTWLGLGLARVIVMLPYPAVMKFGRGLGRFVWTFLPQKRRHVLLRNLEGCFPDLSEHERKELANRHISSMGQGFVEVVLAWWGKDEKLKRLVHLEGLEHLLEAKKKNRGVILLSAHFTSLEIGGRLLAQSTPFHVMYRPSDNAAVEYLMKKNRTLHFDNAVRKSDVKGLIRSLQQGNAIWYAPDQNAGHKNSVFAPFFDIPTATGTATARIAKITGAPVVPFLPLRRKDGKGYDLTIFPPLDNFPTGDDLEDATRINAIFEEWARMQPEDYFWFHRRFRIRPPGEPDFYS